MFLHRKALIYGTIINNFNKPLDLVNISLLGHSGGTITNTKGYFEMQVPANKNISVIISFVGFKKEIIKLFLKTNQKRNQYKIIPINNKS